MGQPGFGNGHGKGPEQGIGQCHRGTAAQAFVERRQRTFHAQPTEQAAGQRADDQGNHHVHAAQAEDQHDADRCDYCIHEPLLMKLCWKNQGLCLGWLLHGAGAKSATW
ncbi:hypothetical protein D9M68_778650 [compost metagenome]